MDNSSDAFIPYEGPQYHETEMRQRAGEFYRYMLRRRSVREIAPRHVPYPVIEDIVLTAAAAPSGAHKQPWTFCVVSNPDLKQQIREAAEQEEFENYHGRMNEEWLDDLKAFGTNWQKPFLTRAPYLIIVFKKPYDLVDGERRQNYYVNESVGIACGFLLAAIHRAGLVSLTHTPSPMNFLRILLSRPENERPFLLVPVGYPEPGTQIPALKRKSRDEVLVKYD